MAFEVTDGSGFKKICPKFECCSAPICPIDPEWKKRVHIKGDPVCFYLRQHAKDALWGQKAGCVARELVAKVGEAYPEVIVRYAPIKTSLARAARSPAKGFPDQRERSRHGL
tara:strand:+ start:2062 stop:2397 length:336 start_codon:yes stop_codon:yes gene_type:complete